MISWGVISAAFAFVPSISAAFQSAGLSFFDNARTFYLLRFIFGAAEAGFFPGIILFLTYWFTGHERARWVGIFMAAIPLSAVIAARCRLILDTSRSSSAAGNGCLLSRGACRARRIVGLVTRQTGPGSRMARA
jgi:MFS family permease